MEEGIFIGYKLLFQTRDDRKLGATVATITFDEPGLIMEGGRAYRYVKQLLYDDLQRRKLSSKGVRSARGHKSWKCEKGTTMSENSAGR